MSFGSQCNEIQSTGSAYHDAGTSPLIEMTTSANMATPDDNYECRLKSSVPFSLMNGVFSDPLSVKMIDSLRFYSRLWTFASSSGSEVN